MKRLCPICSRRVAVRPDASSTAAIAAGASIGWVFGDHGCANDGQLVDPPKVLEAPAVPPVQHIGPPTGIIRAGTRAAQALAALAATPDLTVKQVASAIGGADPYVRKALQYLRSLGYASSSGGRGQTWAVTEAGEEMLAELREAA